MFSRLEKECVCDIQHICKIKVREQIEISHEYEKNGNDISIDKQLQTSVCLTGVM